jgi:hypothetical protein
MRSLLVVCVVVCLSMVAGMASAASPGQVPDATLASFGLGGMQQMTDVQGENIRGMGFAAVQGSGFANGWGGQFHQDSYAAVSPVNPRVTKSNALAAGGSLSVAGVGVAVSLPSGATFVKVSGGLAFGAAFAYAR